MMATQPSTLQHLNIAAAIAAVADRDAAQHGQRRASYTSPSLCACPIAEPFVTDAEHGIAHCTNCEETLHVDTMGVPYRRWPGDLTNADATMKRVVAAAHAEMLELVRTLPRVEQERLERIAKRRPEQFNREARKAIDRYQAAQRSDDSDVHPHERRRRGAPLAGAEPDAIVLDEATPPE